MFTASPPRVSIITPSLNQGAFIESMLRSVLSQDYPNLEILVIDSASTDNTAEILNRYLPWHADRLRFVSEPDRGQAHALNKGVAQTTGEIIAWLNSDDTFEPGAISAAVEFLQRHTDVDLVYGDANFVGVDDRVITRCAHVEPYDWNRLVHYSDFIVQPAAFFTRRAFEAVGGGDESLQYTMDYDLFLKIAAGFKVAYLPRVMANFKWWGQNKSATGGWERLREIERITGAFGARGLPAYSRIEAAFLDYRCAWAEARRARPLAAAAHVMAGTGRVLRSPQAVRSLLSPRCWRVMWTGQVLRWHCMRADQRRNTPTSSAVQSPYDVDRR
jgi:glycosyltransferase involved in cell wall biosynthesis